ncbi:MAG: ABC transporter ATP-binding protein [Dehalococcoidia bacterium]|nr:ABC transporter ATP-binding protein [Dehalococcoidia bacterium]
MTAALEIRGLHVAYGARTVLSGIHLAVQRGEVLGLVGPNGCGKTTLIRAITRVTPWRSGEVLVGNVPVSGLSRRELAQRIAVVPQMTPLPIGYSALDVVLMGRTPHLGFLEHEGADDYAIAREALARAGAAALAERRVDELSGGEQQNVVLARALAQRTPVLLLDEPTAHLDIGHQMAVAALVRTLAHDHGVAVLAAIHDLTLASLSCDRVAVMAGGGLLAEGTPEQALTVENIERAYGVRVRVLHDAAPAPVIVPYSGGAIAP